MKRRDMLLTTAGSLAADAAAYPQAGNGPRKYFELRRYSLGTGEKRQRFLDFVRDSLFPALNRLGVKPVGAFTPLYGQNTPSYSLYLLLPFESLAAFAGTEASLLTDREFTTKAAAILDLPLSDPAFLRFESSLMLAFEGMPALEVPAAVAGKASRIFEMRITKATATRRRKRKSRCSTREGKSPFSGRPASIPCSSPKPCAGSRCPT